MAKDSHTKKISLKIVLDKEPKLNYSKILGKNLGHSRSAIKITESKSALTIEITAKDATALRASANSILRDLQVIEATKIQTK
jgi:tRNA threonylcarbamoyladenosine modification (KEOPS) complex  Pcc1 subunit